MTMIALGSIVGPGCLFGLGYALTLVGPVGALICFGVVGVIVWVLMQSLGEVTTLFPIHGGFVEHAGIFIDPAFSFAMAWLYYLMWAFFLGSDWNSAMLVIELWCPTTMVPKWAWSLIFWGIFSVLTTFGGNLEYGFSLFKFGALGVLFFISILADVGAFGHGYMGFKNWTTPGPVLNGINGFGQCFTLAAAYYVGTEIVAIAAAESKNPRRDVPRGINTITFRILYVFIGAGNGVVFVLSRTLHTLALTGRAPKFFAVTNRRGVPIRAILFSNLWGFTSLMNNTVSAGAIFSYISSATGTAAYIAWATIVFVHIRIRIAAKRQSVDLDTFPFKAPGHISIYYATLGLILFILLIQGYTAFLNPFNWRDFVADYISFPTFFVLFFGYKWYHKTQWVAIDDFDLTKAVRWDHLGNPDGPRAVWYKRWFKSFFVY
ncbi:Amino acid/polyamine transporter I [Pseudohyphozyma bogoriensis]|nr:Amino acid/polyamine transporter I [Pseudohyphozyma bogoriensis]